VLATAKKISGLKIFQKVKTSDPMRFEKPHTISKTIFGWNTDQ